MQTATAQDKKANGSSASTNVGEGLSAGYFTIGDHAELASATIHRLGPEPLMFDEGNFWRFSPLTGAWQMISDELFERTAAAFSGSLIIPPGGRPRQLALKHSDVKGARVLARSMLLTDDSRRFAEAPHGILFRNGFAKVHASKVELLAREPSLLARHAFDFDFDPEAGHPLLDEFFVEVFSDCDALDRKLRVGLLQEFIGTSLIGEATRYQRCLVLHGAGANGKSQFLEIANAIFPPSAVASIPPQEWGRRFQAQALVGKLVNIVNEIPESDILANHLFKSVISGEHVHAEHKFKDAFRFRPTAGHIFSANRLPGTLDHTHGFWRRFMVCPFSRDMEKATCHKTNAARPIIETELPGLVAWAIQGAMRVQRLGGYCVPESSEQAIDDWRCDADPVRRFALTECRPDPTAATSPDALYQAFKTWAQNNGYKLMSSAKFWRRMNEQGPAYRSSHGRLRNHYALQVLVPYDAVRRTCQLVDDM
jgi:P4 family phage/plasmid primase-like protien